MRTSVEPSTLRPDNMVWPCLPRCTWSETGVSAAEDALDRAFDSIDVTHGQRYAEGFVRLVQARLMHATGTPTARVLMIAEEAQALASAREVHLFEDQATDFIARLRDPRNSYA